MQASVDRYHQMMASDIARGRGISVDKVRSDFGQGRALGAKQAKAAGLVDRVATFDDVLSDMTGGRTGKRTGVGASSLLLSQIALARAMRS
jgi:ClpP class serine protease